MALSQPVNGTDEDDDITGVYLTPPSLKRIRSVESPARPEDATTVALSRSKRVLDVVLGGTALAVALPLIAIIAIATRFSSHGPAFFRQERVGYRGRIFRIWKFRTMIDGADHRKQDMHPLLDGRDHRIFKVESDPRVTAFGRFLRKSSLDELPQLLNVLFGDMSLVGPRPLFERELPSWESWHFERLEAKPGITGLWQVSGRSRITKFDDVVTLDLEYIRNWTLASDIRILLATIPAVARGDGAC